MSIFDLFGNDVAKQAAQQQIQGLSQGYGLAQGNIQQAIDALTKQFGLGQGALSTGADTARGDVTGGYGTAVNAINAGTGNAAGALTGNYTAALLPFLQNYQVGAAGQGRLADALGLNGGAAGANAAASAYASNPAFQFMLNQGNQNVLRNAAATGTLASGQTLNALQQQGEGLANQTYQQYVKNLMPFLGTAAGAASGAAGVNTGLGSSLGNLFTGQGTNLANLATGQGGSLSDIAMRQGAGSAGLFTGLGQDLANQYGNLANLGWQFGTGVGNANANATLAQNQGNANQMNFLGSAIGSAAQFLPLLMSDARLKDDIEPVGELYDGTGVYRYRYVWDDPAMTRIGVMAQEVEQTKPEAVHDVGGFKAVDYGKVTEMAARFAKFSNNDNSPSYTDALSKFLKAA